MKKPKKENNTIYNNDLIDCFWYLIRDVELDNDGHELVQEWLKITKKIISIKNKTQKKGL